MTKAYLLAVLERAVKTAAQSALLVLGADQINALNAQWVDVGGFAAGGFVLSVLTSLATSGFGGNGPSATTEVVEKPTVTPQILGKAFTGGTFSKAEEDARNGDPHRP
jgi:hypothetical protein